MGSIIGTEKMSTKLRTFLSLEGVQRGEGGRFRTKLCDGKCSGIRGQEGQGYLSGHRGVTDNSLPLSPFMAVDCECSNKEGSGVCKSRPDLNMWPGFSHNAVGILSKKPRFRPLCPHNAVDLDFHQRFV